MDLRSAMPVDLIHYTTGCVMVYIPFNEKQWLRIETLYRTHHPSEKRIHLPIREVASWFAIWIIEELDYQPGVPK
jgi:hypothetical protein